MRVAGIMILQSKMLSIFDIAMIKVIKEPFAMAAGNGPGGVIAIYTLKDDGDDDEN